MSNDDPEGYFSSGPPGVKFPTIGTKVRFKIVSQEVTQQSKPDGSLMYWEEGKQTTRPLNRETELPNQPANQLVVTGVDLGSGEDARLFVKGKSLNTAVKAALREKGVSSLAVGGVLEVEFYDEEPAKTRGFNPAKLYKVKYDPPGVDSIEPPW